MVDTSDEDDGSLDPRIQIELENLNTATDEINRLEIALDEANTTFRILLNDCTRRLKNKSKSLGSCVEKARPYYEALETARQAQLECQRAAVHYQRANEIHQAAKETAALAEARFLSKQNEWQFDNAWQEMLNHAIIKVRDAETRKAESGREHHKKAVMFNASEQKVQQLEQQLHRHIIKSRPYFEEKSLCNEQLASQKERVEVLQSQVAAVKGAYAASLKELERISEEIHCKRSKNKQVESDQDLPCGPREPGVGAELEPVFSENHIQSGDVPSKQLSNQGRKTLEKSFREQWKISGVNNEVPEKINQLSSPMLNTHSSLPSSPTPRPSTTALPLLDNLTFMKNTIESPSASLNQSSFSLPDSSEIFQKKSVVEDDFGKGLVDLGGEEAYNHTLLNHLMENYESELDCCDVISLSGMSAATESSAMSEKDGNDCCLGEEVENLEELFCEMAVEDESLGHTYNSASCGTKSAHQSPGKHPTCNDSVSTNSEGCTSFVNIAALSQ